jgi:hypothetical protein
MFLLYIDPGTGSILFSLLTGIAAAVYFLLKVLFIKIKFSVTGKSQLPLNYHPFVIYNEGKQYWNVFKPILDEFEVRNIPVMYLSSAKDDPFFEQDFEYITGKYIGEGNKAFTHLNFLQADICLMTTPGLEVYQLKRSKRVGHYSHVLHDTGDVTCYRLFGIDWFDSLLLSGEYQKNDIWELEKLRGTPQKELEVIGSTYLDVLLKKKETIFPGIEHTFTVLVSPSWGPGSLLNAFGERLLDPLIMIGWRIIIRPHPQSKYSEKEMLSRLEQRYHDKINIEWDYASENLHSLTKADIMISDYSGIIFDFIFLFGKPVLYSNIHFNLEMYDASDLDHIPWKFQIIKEIGIELEDCHFENIKDIIDAIIKNHTFNNTGQRARNTAWQHIGESGKRAVDYLVEKQREITSISNGIIE